MKTMNRMFMLIISLILSFFNLTACQNKDFESVRSFEYHFFKEEYEEKYNTVEKTIELESDTDYKIKLTSSTDSGTIAMKLSYVNKKSEETIIKLTAPETEIIEIPSGTTSAFTFAVQIDSDTQGDVKVEVFSN